MAEITAYRNGHFAGVKTLWEEAFANDPPRNHAENAIPQKLALDDGLFFVALDSGEVIGTCMAGYDGHRGWLYSVAVRQNRRGEGIGSALVRHAEAELRQRGCIKINLQIRSGNTQVAAFYRRMGFAAEEVIGFGKLL